MYIDLTYNQMYMKKEVISREAGIFPQNNEGTGLRGDVVQKYSDAQ